MEKNVLYQPVKSNLRTYDCIQKLQQVRDMVTQLVISWAIVISKFNVS